MTTEQDAKSKVHLRLLGRSIGLPSEAREVIEIVWKAAAEFFQAQQPMPAWMQYEPVTDVLTIHGKKYAASLFGNSGFLGNAGDILRIEQGSDDVVTVTKIEPEQADKFATGGLRKNYIPPIPIWAGLGQNPMKPVPPVPPAGAQEPDLLDLKLPIAVRVGGGIFGKGVSLRTVANKLKLIQDTYDNDLKARMSKQSICRENETEAPAVAVNEQLLRAANNYFTRYCRDEAAEFGPDDTGCSQEQHKDALELGEAIVAAEAEKARGQVNGGKHVPD